jgi:hypothetical protein
MTEVLYDPINNELYLFNGMFEVDTKRHIMTIYVMSAKKLGMTLKSKDKTFKVNTKELVHIGWL